MDADGDLLEEQEPCSSGEEQGQGGGRRGSKARKAGRYMTAESKEKNRLAQQRFRDR
jgi:hypothetical protein